ncbi:hypothetical protein HDF24_22795 [Mucilaginibacter sp. X4EP1]|jgi:hypothetical protein|nr:hypothetical protein [Mucilaginibacter sp. X4EP1]MCS3815962.1 hypothetical protein [Mucilaginibacter sp. X4EP1]
MKKITTTPAELLLKAIELQLKALLEQDLKAFRSKQIVTKLVA